MLGKRSDQIAKLVVNANAPAGRGSDATRFGRRADEQPDRGVASDLRAGGRQPHATQARPGQAQRRARDPGQPQEGTAAHAVSASAVRDVVRRGAGRRAVLQGVAGEPRSRPVLPAVHRRRVLRSGSRPQRAAAVATRRPRRRPARHPGAADALSAHRSGRRSAPDSARRDHRQPRRSGVRSARLAAARPDRLLPVPRAPARAAARRAAAWAARRRACAGRTAAADHRAAESRGRRRRSAGEPADAEGGQR